MLLSDLVVGYFFSSLFNNNFFKVAVSTSMLSFDITACYKAWFDCCCTFLWIILYPASMLFAVLTVASRFSGPLAYTISAIARFNPLRNCRIVLAAGVPLFRSTFLLSFLKRLLYSSTDSMVPYRQFR